MRTKKKSFKNIIIETVIDDIHEEDIDKYINVLKDKIVINQFPLKLKLTFTCEFKTPIAFDIVEFHYSHPIQVVFYLLIRLYIYLYLLHVYHQ
jgi:hypothetical protein